MKKFLVAISYALVTFFTLNAADVKTITIESKKNNLSSPENVLVIVPDGASSTNRMPTVYLLNGYTGDEGSWYKCQPRLAELADKYGMIMVMPDGRDSWYWDSPNMEGFKMESFIIDELVPAIDAKYPTKPSKDYRAITGLSMGGHGALKLALEHPDVFGSAGSTSGGVDLTRFKKSWNLAKHLGEYEDNPSLWKDMTVYYIIDKVEPGKINMIFDCGVDDFFAEANNALHEKLVEKKWPHDYISRPGKHTQGYWRNAILYQLVYFDEIFKNKASE